MNNLSNIKFYIKKKKLKKTKKNYIFSISNYLKQKFDNFTFLIDTTYMQYAVIIPNKV